MDHPPPDVAAPGERSLSLDVTEHEAPVARPTRRRFLKWAAAGSIGASAIVGRLVSYTPSAQSSQIPIFGDFSI